MAVYGHQTKEREYRLAATYVNKKIVHDLCKKKIEKDEYIL